MQRKIRSINPDYCGRLERKTFKQYSGLTPESFSNHQNDALLNSTFEEDLDKDLATFNKKENLGWSLDKELATHSSTLA